jgi:uncharacterized protein (DUF58 family)
MSPWRPTAALTRALSVGGVGVALAVVLGRPGTVVLVGPLLLLGALGLLHRPRSHPRVSVHLEHTTLHEGQGTRSLLTGTDLGDVEHAVRVCAPVPHVALHPAGGRLQRLVGPDGELPVVEVGPRRWGTRQLGDEEVALTSRWAGYRWGPTRQASYRLDVLPVRAPFDSRAEAPQPLGLVGAHRSRRTGDGAELDSIRPFRTGDRLRRINWRVSLRTDQLHVVTALAERDTGVLLVVDALADHGASGGIDGAASSLDVTVRAAAALAEHHLRRGDRVALRVIGSRGEQVAYGAGSGHLRRIQSRLAQLVPDDPRHLSAEQLQLPATPGTVVLVLSPMLADVVATATASLVRGGLPVLVVDTLPADTVPATVEGTDPRVADLAWRMRRLEREAVLDRLAALACPVVAWRGPGTLDDVLHRLARRARLPRVRPR